MRVTRLRGARTHNLQSIDLDFEPGSLVVVAGPSGSGKSSLAFGTLYAEGQRRYVESFSAYARQFLERLARPDVDELEPVPAAVAVDRQAPVKTSRSTVGTMTELTDYGKALWARASVLHCESCGRQVTRDTAESVVDALMQRVPGQRVVVTYPLAVAGAESFLGVRDTLVADGYRRVWLDGRVQDLDEVRPSDVTGDVPPAKPTTKAPATKTKSPARSTKKKAAATAPAISMLSVVADRAVARVEDRARLIEALEAAMRRGDGRVDVMPESGDTLRFSSGLHCAPCDRPYRASTPGLFSFNSPIGACEKCKGFGRVIGIDWDRVIPDHSKSLSEGAIKAMSGKSAEWERKQLVVRAVHERIPLDVPWSKMTDEHKRWVIDGEGARWKTEWFGIKRWFEWMESRAYKMHVRVFLSRYRSYDTCTACNGSRLKPEAARWKLHGSSLTDFFKLTVSDALLFVDALKSDDPVAEMLTAELRGRLKMLSEVGLSYLTLDRASRTLSGGEAQRVALTSALGSSLSGAMFVLDEPTVGLHPRDVTALFRVVRELGSGDNVTVVVEHDELFVSQADRVIELGPGAGEEGGRVVFDGPPSALIKAKTVTGAMLRGGSDLKHPRRKAAEWIRLRGAAGNNLRCVDLDIGVATLTCITGPSGSGKSSLIAETLAPAVARAIGEGASVPLPFTTVSGAEQVVGVIHVDQSALGRTSRGNAATYTKAWDVLREAFAKTPRAKERGFNAGMFSFNVAGGRCETCRGEGSETVEMQFLADVTFSCPDCGGRRFTGEILDVELLGKNVADVLEMTLHEVVAHFASMKELAARLGPALEVGLGYLRLGQPLSTLSGGEAQRLKLAEALSRTTWPPPPKGQRGKGFFIVLDEPTAGLHSVDVSRVLSAIDRLVDRGDTVVVVEHDMRVAAHADYVVELGPGAGQDGGLVVASGRPEDVARVAHAPSAPFLSAALSERAASVVSAKRSAKKIVDLSSPVRVEGAKEHNLRDVSVDIPREKFVVVTGPSGSGKSTLAFDVVYAEGQRRYLETLSPYARQYLPQLPRPAVDRVTGIPPTVSLEQRHTRGGANSTVATITEAAHYIRLLYARIGLLHCPDCQVPIAPRPPASIADEIQKSACKHGEVVVLVPALRAKKGSHSDLFARARRNGYTEARIDGAMTPLTGGMKLSRFVEHDVDLVLATVTSATKANEVLILVTRALAEAEGVLRLMAGGVEKVLSSRRACPSCGKGFAELDPRFFSFNTKQGQCERCDGKGEIELGVPSKKNNANAVMRVCPACDGHRLSPLARAVTIGGRPITDFLSRGVSSARVAFASLEFEGRDQAIAAPCLDELHRRLGFLEEVGLGYLGLDRGAHTLSGGELQRVRLAAQLGSGLTGVLYVLDEPTIGLHPRDSGRLLGAIRSLVDKGCSVLVVEHDTEMIRAADHVIDVGPGGGRHGGQIVAVGTPAEVAQNPASATGASLAHVAAPSAEPKSTRDCDWLEVKGASGHNLQNVDLKVPLARLVSVTGVSGSGKSTLVREVLLRATRRALELETREPLPHKSITGAQALRRAVEVDQSPIGRTPRSVPATYIGIWDELRKLVAGTADARARGYGPSRFSFNVAGGRCTGCDGQGANVVEMSFLPEVLVPCEDCGGRRFDPETLAVRFHGLSVGEILDLEVDEAVRVFAQVPKVRKPLEVMAELGLGYLKLGQPSNTLSGGEAQRLKLVAELSVSTGPSLYVLDEPTTGLHRSDVARLIKVLRALVERGDTVVVIEHHLDMVAASDWVIDLGPEGGEAGGQIVVQGTPRSIAKSTKSHTGIALKREWELS